MNLEWKKDLEETLGQDKASFVIEDIQNLFNCIFESDYVLEDMKITLENKRFILTIITNEADIMIQYLNEPLQRVGFIWSFKNKNINIQNGGSHLSCTYGENNIAYLFEMFLSQEFMHSISKMHVTILNLETQKISSKTVDITDLKNEYQDELMRVLLNNPGLIVEKINNPEEKSKKKIHNFGTDYAFYRKKYKSDILVKKRKKKGQKS